MSLQLQRLSDWSPIASVTAATAACAWAASTSFVPIELSVDGRRSAFRIPGVCDVALAPHTDPVSGAVQDVRVHLPKRFIFRTAQAARTLVMKLLGPGPLSSDHWGQNAFYARLEFQGAPRGAPFRESGLAGKSKISLD